MTPITRSGALRVDFEQQGASGKTITLKANQDFLGYELAYYAVTSRGDSRVRVTFTSAEEVRGETHTPATRPIYLLFRLPGSMGHVRLVYLTRKSDADHDRAIVAARDGSALEAMTNAVQTNPASGCRAERHAVCVWAPAGIALLPQMKRNNDWVAAGDSPHRRPPR